MILNSLAILWLAAASAVIGLALYRKLVSRTEDDHLHLSDVEAQQLAQQSALSSKLDFVDKWGITLTIAVGVFGVILAAMYAYQGWVASSQLAP